MSDAAAAAGSFPRVPAHAWAWLQRSRPVVAEVSSQLEGCPPQPGFVDRLRERFAEDPFTRDVVISVIAEVAFNSRVPLQRPAGTNWDRGLTWWAAAITGATPAEYEARGVGPPAVQRALFDDAERSQPSSAAEQQRSSIEQRPAAAAPSPRRARSVSPERAALIRDLRELLAAADGDQVPASALRQLLRRLEAE